MPYKTFIMMDDKARSAKLIATLQLDALTACGDLIDLGDRGVFEVVRVSYVYVWRGSSFVVTGKRLYCKKAKKQWATRVKTPSSKPSCTKCIFCEGRFVSIEDSKETSK